MSTQSVVTDHERWRRVWALLEKIDFRSGMPEFNGLLFHARLAALEALDATSEEEKR